MATQTFETLKLEVEDGVAILTLNRPDKLNAFNTQMMKDMIAAFDLTDADDAVGAVIVTGAPGETRPAERVVVTGPPTPLTS